MARYSAGYEVADPTSQLVLISLYSSASVGFRLVEVAFWRATGPATLTTYVLKRLTTQGTPGTALTAAKHDPDSPAAACSAFQAHSVNPSFGDFLPIRNTVSAVGGGFFVHLPEGIACAPGTDNGIGLQLIAGEAVAETGLAHVVWEETTL